MGGAAAILFRLVVACRPWAWLVRRSGALVRSRPPVATPAGAGGGGRGGARRADPAASPPERRGPFWGRGDAPSAPGGAEGRRPRGRRPGGSGGERGGRVGRAAAPRPPAPWIGPWPPSLSPFVSGAPPWGIHAGAGRGLVGRQWVSVAGGGRREMSSPRSAPPPLPGGPQSGPLRLCLPGCRLVAGRQRVMRECAGGPLGALGARLRLPRLRCPPPGCSGPPGGDAGPLSLRPASVRPWAWGGEGEGVVPWSPDAAPGRPRGAGLVVLAHGGQPSTGRAHSSPAPLYLLRAGPPAPLAVAARRRLTGGGGGRAGEFSGQRVGSAVSS